MRCDEKLKKLLELKSIFQSRTEGEVVFKTNRMKKIIKKC